MRLSERERKVIVDAVHSRFGPDAHVYLFGSRTDDTRRGGDIDLFVDTDLAAYEAQGAKFAALSDIQIALGDQKIDMVLSPFVSDGDLIKREIDREAIAL